MHCPVINFRQSLLHLVRIRAIDYLFDDLLEDVTTVCEDGDVNALANTEMWGTFLSPAHPSVPPQYSAVGGLLAGGYPQPGMTS